jgi:hypothetical protein
MDAIERFFNEITPEHFFRDTSAIGDLRMGTPSADQFDRFVTDLVFLTNERASKDGEFNPFAVLRSAERQRIFLADADETPDAWAARLHREATDMNAVWFYVALLSPGRVYEGDQPESIERTEDAIDAALDDGRLSLGLAWLAVRRDTDGEANRAGLIALDQDGKPGENTEGVLDPDGNPFAHVLEGDRAL